MFIRFPYAWTLKIKNFCRALIIFNQKKKIHMNFKQIFVKVITYLKYCRKDFFMLKLKFLETDC